MKKLAITLLAVFGLVFISSAHSLDVEHPVKKSLKHEHVHGKIKNPHKLKAHTNHCVKHERAERIPVR